MPVQSYYSTDTYLHINGVGKDGFVRVYYADVPGNSWNQNRLNKGIEALQNLIDQRTLRTDLPADDPARISDPARPDWFWEGSDIVARPVVVSDPVWDGVKLTWTTRVNK